MWREGREGEWIDGVFRIIISKDGQRASCDSQPENRYLQQGGEPYKYCNQTKRTRYETVVINVGVNEFSWC
jgi:hypothetical protein